MLTAIDATIASTMRATKATKYPTSIVTIQILKSSVSTRAAVPRKAFQNLLSAGPAPRSVLRIPLGK